MNDDTIRMAREAGFVDYELEDYTVSGYDVRYERLVALARADEREGCAKVCDDRATKDGFEGCYANACAESIRARGNT